MINWWRGNVNFGRWMSRTRIQGRFLASHTCVWIKVLIDQLQFAVLFFFFRKKNYTFNDHNHETRAFYLTKQCYTYNWESFMTCFTAALAKPCAAEFASLLALQIYLHANFTSYVFNTPCLSSTNCPYGPYQLKFCSVTFTTFTTWTTSPFIMILCSPKSRLNSTAYNAANANLVMLLAASIHPLRSHTMIPTSLYLKT
jgi:hypothetical protein